MSAFATLFAQTGPSASRPIAVIRGRLNVRQVLKIGHGERNDRNVSGYGLIGFSTYAADLNLIASCMGGLPNAFV
jgi:hypothetical protein